MKHMWGLIIGACVGLVAVGLLVDGKLNQKWFIRMLVVALCSGAVVAYFGRTKKFKAGLDGFELELESFRREVDTVTQDGLDVLRREVAIQKEAIP